MNYTRCLFFTLLLVGCNSNTPSMHDAFMKKFGDLPKLHKELRPGMTRLEVDKLLGGAEETKIVASDDVWEARYYQRKGHRLNVYIDQKGYVIASVLDP